jgi:probable F420-dependent oxidoreductase
MRIGALFPSIDWPAEPGVTREFAQTAEALGFAHLTAFDVVVTGGEGGYPADMVFQDAIVLLSFIAAATERIGLATGIVALPPRQTTLFAKQAANLDALSGGRLRLGLGTGFNPVVHRAMGSDYDSRTTRMAEQIEILRRLWTEPSVDHHSADHDLPGVGILPRPLQQPIPIWIAATSETSVQLCARQGDGWLSTSSLPTEAEPTLRRLREVRAIADRTGEFGVQGRLAFGSGDPAVWRDHLDGWRELGATDVAFTTIGAGFTAPREHLDAIRAFAETGLLTA